MELRQAMRTEGDTLPDLKPQIVELVKERGLQYREEAFRLASGEMSHDYIDGKRTVSRGADLLLVSQAILQLTERRGIEFECVGGLTMGADALAHGVALAGGTEWFTVRKEAKGHGRGSMLEGAAIEERTALLVDDIVTTGGSIKKACDAVTAAGGRVVLAVALVDRSGRTGPLLEADGVPFEPILTWHDLGIEPVEAGGRVPA
jgi:orotate phosphoribosyltransferase